MMGRRHGAQTFPTVLMTNTDSVYPCLFSNFYSLFQGAKFYCSIFRDANVQHGSNGSGGFKRIFGGLTATFLIFHGFDPASGPAQGGVE